MGVGETCRKSSEALSRWAGWMPPRTGGSEHRRGVQVSGETYEKAVKPAEGSRKQKGCNVRLYHSSKSGNIIELSLFLWCAIEGSRKWEEEARDGGGDGGIRWRGTGR